MSSQEQAADVVDSLISEIGNSGGGAKLAKTSKTVADHGAELRGSGKRSSAADSPKAATGTWRYYVLRDKHNRALCRELC
jgi:hypothetical protein